MLLYTATFLLITVPLKRLHVENLPSWFVNKEACHIRKQLSQISAFKHKNETCVTLHEQRLPLNKFCLIFTCFCRINTMIGDFFSSFSTRRLIKVKANLLNVAYIRENKTYLTKSGQENLLFVHENKFSPKSSLL